MRPSCLLIAEADEDLLEMHRRFLARNGYEVETASGGLECLTKLRRLVPDVLILDLELLWGGGAGVLALLHEDFPTQSVPVVLLTGGLSHRTLCGPAAPPAVQCLRKPFRLPELLAIVRSAAAQAGQPQECN
jgi:DNA-binding response OmpR family regulator